MNFSSIQRYWHTLRYLKLQQIVGQFGLRVKSLLGLRVRISEAPEFEGVRKCFPSDVPKPSGADYSEESILKGEFTFIGRELNLNFPPEWESEEAERLWLYNLHYFEWLMPLRYEDAKFAVENWINTFDNEKGRCKWEPYSLSLRLQSWALFFFGRRGEETQRDVGFSELLWESMYRQVEWLKKNLETHILANHYFENAVALFVCGVIFEGAAARQWLAQGRRILVEQIAEQQLQDGMHYERSPMYHSRFCYVLMLCWLLAEDELNFKLEESLTVGMRAFQRLVDPDGEPYLLNDGARGIYPRAETLSEYLNNHLDLESSESGCWSLGHAGYYGASDKSLGNSIVIDAGKIGPDYQPGHAHADCFSFILHKNGHPVFVDSGVSNYLVSERRLYERSTAAHNTVTVDFENQSEVWGAFRLARRASPREIVFREKGDSFTLSGWHDGFCRLDKSIRHYRDFKWKDGFLSSIRDRVVGAPERAIDAYWHFSPSCSVTRKDDSNFTVCGEFGSLDISFSGAAEIEQFDAPVAVHFNELLQSSCLRVRFAQEEVIMRIRESSPAL